MARPAEWLSKWISIIAATLYFVAVALRAWLSFDGRSMQARAFGLLLLWVLLFGVEALLSRRWPAYIYLHLLFQTLIVFLLLALPGTPDFMAALLGVLSMQAMLRLSPRAGAAWIGLCALLMLAAFYSEFQLEAIALALVYTAGNVFLGSYALTVRRAQAARLHNQALAAELEQANRQLQEYSAQLELLAAARERSRLARDLHDSVTQTVFSMNLTSQSAALLVERDPSQAQAQLERLYALSRSALAEMQLLIDELKPAPAPQASEEEGRLPQALQLMLAGDLFSSLQVSVLTVGSVQVEGSVLAEASGALQPAEQQALLRIIHEALTNTLKHAGAAQVQIRLHLQPPFWVEVEDHGRGFDPAHERSPGRFGLASMRARAGEIGWTLQIESSPGAGTRIHVEKPAVEVGPDGRT